MLGGRVAGGAGGQCRLRVPGVPGVLGRRGPRAWEAGPRWSLRTGPVGERLWATSYHLGPSRNREFGSGPDQHEPCAGRTVAGMAALVEYGSARERAGREQDHVAPEETAGRHEKSGIRRGRDRCRSGQEMNLDDRSIGLCRRRSVNGREMVSSQILRWNGRRKTANKNRRSAASGERQAGSREQRAAGGGQRVTGGDHFRGDSPSISASNQGR